jgi:hypothetical protein
MPADREVLAHSEIVTARATDTRLRSREFIMTGDGAPTGPVRRAHAGPRALPAKPTGDAATDQLEHDVDLARLRGALDGGRAGEPTGHGDGAALNRRHSEDDRPGRSVSRSPESMPH